jgi:hypothetical protein
MPTARLLAYIKASHTLPSINTANSTIRAEFGITNIADDIKNRYRLRI